ATTRAPAAARASAMQPPEVTHTARSPARGANTSRSRAVSSQAFAYSGRPSPLIRAPLDGILSFFVEKSTPRAVAPRVERKCEWLSVRIRQWGAQAGLEPGGKARDRVA